VKPIRTLLLDADGVVQTPVDGWRDSVASLCGDSSRVEAFLEEVFRAERPCLTSNADFATALGEVLERWGSVASVVDALELWMQIEPREDLLRLVDALRTAGIRVGLASNQQSVRAAYMADVLGYVDRFDDLLFSCRLGHAKPDTAYFRTVLDVLGVQGDQVLFIDDHAANVAAARNSGFNAEIYDSATGVGGMLSLLARHGISGIAG